MKYLATRTLIVADEHSPLPTVAVQRFGKDAKTRTFCDLDFKQELVTIDRVGETVSVNNVVTIRLNSIANVRALAEDMLRQCGELEAAEGEVAA